MQNRQRYRQLLISSALASYVLSGVSAVQACPADPYIGSVCITAANYCPQGYIRAAGQTLTIVKYPALFAVLGTTYGGDGQTIFALPDLKGRVPVGVGSGTKLTLVTQGQTRGLEAVTTTATVIATTTATATLKSENLPLHDHPHNHQLYVSTKKGTESANTKTLLAGVRVIDGSKTSLTATNFEPYDTDSTITPLNSRSIGYSSITNVPTSTTPISIPISIPIPISISIPTLPPQIGLLYCIALEGVFPPHSDYEP